MKAALILVVAAVLLRAVAIRLMPFPTPPPAPGPDLTPETVVRTVVEALQHVNSPRPNSGVFVAYQFASPENKKVTGPYGTFLVGVKHADFAALMSPGAAEFGPIQRNGVAATQNVVVHPSGGSVVRFEFSLRQQRPGGVCPGCWMVDGVAPLPSR